MARKNRAKRSDADYIKSATNLSKFVPSLKKYKRRKKLTRHEKSAITRREKQLRFVIKELRPLTKLQAKKMKGSLYAPGVQAVELRGLSGEAKMKIVGKNMMITSNGRQWIYIGISKENVRRKSGVKRTAKEAFEKKLPIEQVAELARKAFKKYKVRQVHLWAKAGIVGNAFDDFAAFVRYVDEHWSGGKYISNSGFASDPGAWINGIAVLVEEH